MWSSFIKEFRFPSLDDPPQLPILLSDLMSVPSTAAAGNEKYLTSSGFVPSSSLTKRRVVSNSLQQNEFMNIKPKLLMVSKHQQQKQQQQVTQQYNLLNKSAPDPTHVERMRTSMSSSAKKSFRIRSNAEQNVYSQHKSQQQSQYRDEQQEQQQQQSTHSYYGSPSVTNVVSPLKAKSNQSSPRTHSQDSNTNRVVLQNLKIKLFFQGNKPNWSTNATSEIIEQASTQEGKKQLIDSNGLLHSSSKKNTNRDEKLQQQLELEQKLLQLEQKAEEQEEDIPGEYAADLLFANRCLDSLYTSPSSSPLNTTKRKGLWTPGRSQSPQTIVGTQQQHLGISQRSETAKSGGLTMNNSTNHGAYRVFELPLSSSSAAQVQGIATVPSLLNNVSLKSDATQNSSSHLYGFPGKMPVKTRKNRLKREDFIESVVLEQRRLYSQKQRMTKSFLVTAEAAATAVTGFNRGNGNTNLRNEEDPDYMGIGSVATEGGGRVRNRGNRRIVTIRRVNTVKDRMQSEGDESQSGNNNSVFDDISSHRIVSTEGNNRSYYR